MKEIAASALTQTIKDMFLELSYVGGKDLMCALDNARTQEESPLGQLVLDQLMINYQIAAKERVAICQDTGMSVVFAEVGQEVHITEGALKKPSNRACGRLIPKATCANPSCGSAV